LVSCPGVRGSGFFGGAAGGSLKPAGSPVLAEGGSRTAPWAAPRSAGTRRGPRADRGNAPAVGRAGAKQTEVVVEHKIHGIALQPANLDGLFALLVHHAGALAEHFGGTHAATALAQYVGFEDHARRAARVTSHD